MPNHHITEARKMLDQLRQVAMQTKGDAPIAWAWNVTDNLVKVEAHVLFDFEVVYFLDDMEVSFSTTSYSEAVNVLAGALA